MNRTPRSPKLVEHEAPVVVETVVEAQDSRSDDSILADHFRDERGAKSGGAVEIGAQDKLMAMMGDQDSD